MNLTLLSHGTATEQLQSETTLCGQEASRFRVRMEGLANIDNRSSTW